MNTFEKKIKEASGKIRMRASERALLREQIVSFMEYHPHIQGAVPAKKKVFNTTPYTEKFSYIHFTPWRVRGVMASLALLVVVVTPLLAEQTVPGDVLYPMKVRVNEEVLSQLSFSSYEKVAWETRRVERRIAEARLLAKEGKLTNEVEAQITETVKEHTASAQKELATLRESDVDEAAVAQVVLESALDVQSAVLDTDQQTSSTTESDTQIRALATVVRDAKAMLAPSVAEVATLSSYERFSARVEETTTRARDLFASIDGSITDEERNDIQRRIEDVDRRIVATRAAYDANTTGPAIEGLKGALSDTQKLISFMTDIDVRTGVSLETLVPKELTLEERVMHLEESRKSTHISMALVSNRNVEITDTLLKEKVSLGLERIQVLLTQMDVDLTAEGALEGAEEAEKEMQALIKDLLTMTDYIGGVDTEVVAGENGALGTSTEPIATSTLDATEAATSTTE